MKARSPLVMALAVWKLVPMQRRSIRQSLVVDDDGCGQLVPDLSVQIPMLFWVYLHGLSRSLTAQQIDFHNREPELSLEQVEFWIGNYSRMVNLRLLCLGELWTFQVSQSKNFLAHILG